MANYDYVNCSSVETLETPQNHPSHWRSSEPPQMTEKSARDSYSRQLSECESGELMAWLTYLPVSDDVRCRIAHSLDRINQLRDLQP